MARRALPIALLITALSAIAACADSTAPKQDCIIVGGILTCTPG